MYHDGWGRGLDLKGVFVFRARNCSSQNQTCSICLHCTPWDHTFASTYMQMGYVHIMKMHVGGGLTLPKRRIEGEKGGGLPACLQNARTRNATQNKQKAAHHDARARATLRTNNSVDYTHTHTQPNEDLKKPPRYGQPMQRGGGRAQKEFVCVHNKKTKAKAKTIFRRR
jgi:hypothetical protein